MNTPVAPKKNLTTTLLAAIAAAGLPDSGLFAQTSGVWDANANVVWSDPAGWLDGDVAHGIGQVADFSQLNITANRTVTIDTTSRTIGTLLFGDTTGPAFSGYTIAASGGATLTFNNGGSGASIVQGANSGANTLSAPMVLSDNLGIANDSASTLTLSGGITAGTAGAKTITNSGSGVGGVTLSGVIGDGSGTTGIVQNSASSQLTLSGANTFTGGVAVRSGTVLVTSNAAALGAGAVLLGDTSGSADATLALGTANTADIANAITVQAGGTGKRTLSGNGTAAGRSSGAITLDGDLSLLVAGSQNGRNTGAFLATSGTIGGSGDLNLEVEGDLSTSNSTNSPQMDSLSVGGLVTTTGAINNVGSGSGRAVITGVISNASALNQNSATSMLSLTGANTYSGPTRVNAGILRATTSATALSPNSAVTVASGATLQLGSNQSTTQVLTLSGHGAGYSSGALESTNAATYAGAVDLAADATVGSTLANTTLTLSGGVTGPGRSLSVTGVGNTTISGAIATGSGGLVKEGSGTLSLSAANSHSGATSINNGVLALSHADALGGGGAVVFGGGALRHTASNELDLGGRITGSVAAVAIDTAGRNVTYSGIEATNTGGLLKLGAGRLTLSGANAYSGVTAVNTGVLAVSEASALPSGGSGGLFIDRSGALNTGGAYADVQAWLGGGAIAAASTGVIALTAGSSENIDFSGYSGLGLGASNNVTYTGTIAPAASTYRLGGGGATLTLSGTNALTGANALAVNGNVTLTGANDLEGATTVSSGVLTLGGAGGNLAGSAITLGGGTTLAVTSATSGTPVTRAAAVRLDRATLTVAGNSMADSTDAITGALTVGSGGHSLVTLTPNASRNTLLSAGGLVREAGATAVVRGAGLGANSLASATAGASNISFSAAPTLLGAAGTNTTDRGIVAGLVGDTSASGTGFGATAGLLTYDSTNGLRLLSSGEYKTSIASGQTQLDNVRLGSTGGIATTTIAADTTINSLSLQTSGATSAGVSVTGVGKLTVNSGVIYSNSVTATAGNTVSTAVDFAGREGIVLVGGTNNLTLSGALSNTGGNGLTIHAPGRTVTLSGAGANTHTGTTRVNGGTLALNKTAGTNAIAGDLLVNSGGVVSHSGSNQIADTADVTVDDGSLVYRSETINNLTVTNSGSASTASSNGIALTVNGTLTVANDATLNATAAAATITVSGATNLSNGGSLTLGRSQNTAGAYDSVTTLNGGLNITHKASGAYTPITIGHGSGLGQSGAKLVLGGDVAFTGNATNTQTVVIDAIRGSGRQGVIDLTTSTGDRVFSIGDGAAAVDLRITAALQNGDSVTSGLVKSGLGTLELSGANTYAGSTTIAAGTLRLGSSDRIADASGLVLGGGTFATAGFSETLGTLSLAAGSFIDFGAGSSALVFADSSALSWTGSVSLSLLNFTAGLDSIRFGTTSGGLTGGQLGQITINGMAAAIDANGFLSAVPEPSAYAGLTGAAGLLVAGLRRRRRSA